MNNSKKLSVKATSIVLLFGMILSSLAFSTSFSSSAVRITNGSWINDYNTDWYNEDLTEYEINNEQELAGLAKLVNTGNNFKNKIINLNSDLDLEEHYWVPIGDGSNWNIVFQGTFNGQKHEIKNMKIGENSRKPLRSEYAGLFGATQDATITGIRIDDNSAIYANSSNVGSIVGSATDSIISDCINNAYIYSSSVECEFSAGGICGTLTTSGSDKNAKIVECINNGTIGSAHSGGICSYNLFSTVERCINNGRIRAWDDTSEDTGCSAAGIVERSTAGIVIGCSNYGEISTESHNRSLSFAGGIVSISESSNIRACCNSASVSSDSSPAQIGGIAACSFDGTEIEHCNNHGNVFSSGDGFYPSKIGGICGKAIGNEKSVVIREICNYGQISSASNNVYVGGLVGETDGSVTIENVANLARGYWLGTQFILNDRTIGNQNN